MKKKNIYFIYFINIFIYAIVTYLTSESFSDIHSFFNRFQFYQIININTPIQYTHIYLTLFFIIFITIPLMRKFFDFPNKYIGVSFYILGIIMLTYSIFKYYPFKAFQTLLTITFVILVIFWYIILKYFKE